jgi:hypothetical protein
VEAPALLDDPEVDAVLGNLAGPSVPLVRGLRAAWNSRTRKLDISEFLAQIDESFHSFVASRLAGPVHESEEQAKGYLLRNAEKLKSLLRIEETENLARENDKPGIDFETQSELAREATLLAQARHKKTK